MQIPGVTTKRYCTQAYDENEHLKTMERCNISKSILSISSPGTHLIPGDDAAARELARKCNEYLADIKKRRPDKFGFFATIPMPDIDGSLKEIAYALDELEADGFCIFSNHHGKYIGNDIYDPVWAELSRRKATVFMHPTIPCMAVGDRLVNAMPAPGFPPAIFEFFIEEVRVVLGLFSTRAVIRYPDMTWIIAHCGGALPPIIERFCNFGTSVFGGKVELSSEKMKEVLKKQFYFDLAGFPLPDQIHGLMRLVDPSRLLYGSDYPYTPGRTTIELSDKLDERLASALGDRASAEAACLHNAEKLFNIKH